MFILLVSLQVCILSRVHIFHIATPVIYSYFLIKLPVRLNRNIVLLLGMLIGLAVDLFGHTFGYTIGTNMLAAVTVAFARFRLAGLFKPRDVTENVIPSFVTFGRSMFLRYSASVMLLHIILLSVIDAGASFVPSTLFLRIAGCFAVSYPIMYGMEMIYCGKTER